MFFDNEIETSLVQLEKVSLFISVTPSGIIILEIAVYPNAFSPISVMELGIFMSDKTVQ